MKRLRGLLWAVWDPLSVYLPVMLMALLALGTYWLVRNTPSFTAPEPGKAVRHEVDYYMHTFAVKTFDRAGRLKSEVAGIEARHFADTDTLEIEQPRIRAINEQGHLTTARANRAISNGDGSEVQLIGDAVVVRDGSTDAAGAVLPSMEFRGEFLHAFMNNERIRSHLPVVLTRGKDRFTADTLDYDNLDRVMNLRGRVKGVLTPGTAK